jgi:hypothetical protein
VSRPTAAEKAEAQKLKAQAREAETRAALNKHQDEVATALLELLSVVQTRVDRSPRAALGLGHETQRSQQKPLRKLNGTAWMRVVPPEINRFLLKNGAKSIPGEFWLVDEEHAIVACPCGEEPRVGLGNVHFCAGEGCNRIFFFIGSEVRSVTLTDEDLATLAAPEDA